MTEEIKIAEEKNVVEQSVPTTERKCGQCGALLNEEQIFCPHCGQKADLQTSDNIPEAIAQFNQGIEKQAKKKKKKAKLLIVLLIVIGVLISGIVSIYFVFNSQAEKIIEEIESSSPSVSTIESDYDSLTPIGQFVFRTKIITAFEEQVEEKQYISLSSSLINENSIDDYQVFKRIANALNITDEDNTNVVKHIDHVLKLEQYEEYNDVSKCVSNSIESYTDCLENIGDASDFSSYYLVKLYIGYAHTDAKSALSSARTYSSGDSLCTQYVNALDTIEEELSDLYYGYGYYSSSSVTAAMSTINGIVSDIAEAEDSVESIVNNIPSIN